MASIMRRLIAATLLLACATACAVSAPTAAPLAPTTQPSQPLPPPATVRPSATATPDVSPSPTRQPPTVTPVPPTATPTRKPTPVPLALGDIAIRNVDGMAMVFVPEGEFEMGSDDAQVAYAVEICNLLVRNCKREWFADQQPTHEVALDGFWIDRTEVINAQYAACVAAGKCAAPRASKSYTRASYHGSPLYDEYPVLYVNWNDASDYCAWAGARLPTEAEWEYAARGPASSRYPWGDGFRGILLNYCDANCPMTSWRDSSTCDGYADTAPVGSYPQGVSWCGAYDLAGNVWEWVADWYGPYATGRQVNPTGPASGEVRVVRGGSWDHEPCDALSAYRTWFSADKPYGEWDIVVGFRCARDEAP